MADEGIYSVVLGTAGHIDHGKSSLVRRLTGIDPDRLAEEKERGMTIDLGFAPFKLQDGRRVGIIDVPGHERFVKNMVAGATGIDLVMLVVAADDGIMPQTREHLQIMTLLGLKRGMILINKIDAAEPEMIGLVEEEVVEMTRGTFLEGAPRLRISAATGEGFEALIERINRMVLETPPREAGGVFRMPIQRVFSAKGFGTVVTGVPLSGSASLGDPIEILPGGQTGKIRSLQAYKSDVTRVRAGHSSALSLAGVDHKGVTRGDVAAAPGSFVPAPNLDARLRYLAENRRPLKHMTPVRLHVGTKEAVGRVAILDRTKLDPGEEGFVQIRCDEPLVVDAGDPFILRLQSPLVTIGGGRILSASPERRRKFAEGQVPAELRRREESLDDRRGRVEVELKSGGARLFSVAELAQAAHQPEEFCRRVVAELGEELLKFRDRFVHREAFAAVCDGLVERVERFHRANPLRAGIPRLTLLGEARLPEELAERALEALAEAGRLATDHDRIRRAGFEPKLSRDDAQAADALERAVRAAGLATPNKKELLASLGVSADRAERVLDVLLDKGAIVQLRDGVLLHAECEREARRKIEEELRARGSIEPGRAKDLLGSTRKYVIPLLEHFDEVGLTVRDGNRRLLKKK
jgi:selenocysteine-specific elongation factor